MLHRRRGEKRPHLAPRERRFSAGFLALTARDAASIATKERVYNFPAGRQMALTVARFRPGVFLAGERRQHLHAAFAGPRPQEKKQRNTRCRTLCHDYRGPVCLRPPSWATAAGHIPKPTAALTLFRRISSWRIRNGSCPMMPATIASRRFRKPCRAFFRNASPSILAARGPLLLLPRMKYKPKPRVSHRGISAGTRIEPTFPNSILVGKRFSRRRW